MRLLLCSCALALVACAQVIGIDPLTYHDPNPDGAVPAAHRSCTDLARSCGPMATDSCCAADEVQGGTFLRDGNARYPATVSDFVLDRFEVTVGRFRAFVAAGGGTQENPPLPGSGAHPRIAGSGWDAAWNQYLSPTSSVLKNSLNCSNLYRYWSPDPGADDSRPINCITWYEAFAFCAWDGGRLPTETEWVFAATGGDEQRSYPWGEATPTGANAAFDCLGDGMNGCDHLDVRNVGSLPLGVGRWGHADLAGNIAEWLLDRYEPYAPTCVDCAILADATDRISRGGDFGDSPEYLRSDSRGHSVPILHTAQSGVRCARSKAVSP